VTLTNINKNDIDRIIKYRLTPINVSVHTTNPDLRVFMLKNKNAGNVVPLIRKLVEQGITVNAQIVLCRGINDKNELDRSLSDLSSLYPGLNSISVVPVGITKHREGLCELKPYNSESSIEVIRQIEKWQKEFIKKYGSRIVYPADEFYIMGEQKLPEYEAYQDFPQIENGVGLISLLLHEFDEYMEELKHEQVIDRKVSIVTGVSAYNYIKELASRLEEKYSANINVFEIKNEFFGENVTVAGLLTGRDIVSQLEGRDLGDELLICRCTLKSGEDLFLDDYTVSMLENILNVKIKVVENSGKAFVDSVLGIN
jgi:putative radical SAM enzyme (TIGR03279 family)